MAHIGIDARFFSDTATGIGKHVYELIQHLAKLDQENQYTIFLKPEQYDKFQIPNNKFQKKATSAKHYSLAEQTQFLKQINAENFDLMVFPQFNAPLLYKRPFVVTIHDLTLHKFPGKKKTDPLSRGVYKYLIRNVCRKAAHCFAVSQNTKKDMIEILKVPENKITVTLNGVSQRFKPLSSHKSQDTRSNNCDSGLETCDLLKKYHLPPTYFLYTGVMRNHKNILGMIEAYQLFCKNLPSPRRGTEGEGIPSLVIAGPQDPIYFKEIQELAQNDPRIVFPGFIDEEDINAVMAGANAFIFPSFYEGFGIPPLEAMQCGVPTITSNTSSLPEACGEATLYFDPYNIEEMAAAMERIYTDEALRPDLIQKGFQQCQKFKWEDMTEKMLAVYKEILRTSPS